MSIYRGIDLFLYIFRQHSKSSKNLILHVEVTRYFLVIYLWLSTVGRLITQLLGTDRKLSHDVCQYVGTFVPKHSKHNMLNYLIIKSACEWCTAGNKI
jgi:hypothetical protein